jgi:hypothetical protein
MVTTRSQNKKQNCISHKRRKTIKKRALTFLQESKEFFDKPAAKREFSSAFAEAIKAPGTRGLKTYKGVLDDIFAAAAEGNLASRYGLDGDSVAW